MNVRAAFAAVRSLPPGVAALVVAIRGELFVLPTAKVRNLEDWLALPWALGIYDRRARLEAFLADFETSIYQVGRLFARRRSNRTRSNAEGET